MGRHSKWYPYLFLSLLAGGSLPAIWSLASTDAAAVLAGPPVIAASNGVLDATTFDASKGIVSGGWIAVFGTNLAPTTRSWTTADFSSAKAPTQLEGVRVTVNSKAAYVSFIMRGADFGLSYDQINALVPTDTATGPVQVTVTTPAGTSAPYTVTKVALSPALVPFEPAGRKYLAATTGDGVEYIGQFALFGGALLGRPIRPAHTNDVLSFYGSGFGPTDPPVADGTLVAQASKLTRNVNFWFGSAAATVEYAGLAPGLVGVYQFNVRVPELKAGDVEVAAEIGSLRTQTGKFVTVGEVEYPTFDHLKFSQFRLSGKHVYTPCIACHVNSRFAGTPDACRACHLGAYQGTVNPNHAAAGYPQECQGCHVTSNFRPAAQGHLSGLFPLTGAHTAVACASCHSSGQYKGLSTACATCHLKVYQATTNPNHQAAGFSQDCAACHATASFKGATLDHSKTDFPLTGAHVNAQCIACHSSGQYSGLNTQCAACHLNRYQATTNPNHVAGGYPTNCAVCHTTASFRGASFDHSLSRFPLTGAHRTQQCAACHPGNQYTSRPTDCASCHLASYQATRNPDHAAAGFPTNCALCHNTTRFAGATFDHSRTDFALTGRHLQARCASCHSSGVYNGLNRACSSCHLSRYQATTNPNHVAGGFPRDCALCHSTSQWAGARFNHDVTRFPLTGAHTSLACASCHSDNVYSGKSTSCASCHLARFNATTNPNHVAAGFPTNCATCHNTTSFRGAVFNHTAFPIYSGAHNGRWNSCSACHTNPANFKEFSCLGCHTKTSTDSHHSGVGNYVYASANCYACHPTGRD